MTAPEQAGLQKVNLPWSPDGDVVANFAIGACRESLLHWMTVDGGIHCETLLSVAGALAGMAGQTALMITHIQPQKPIPENGFMVASTNSGEHFYFGDLLNQYLVPQGGFQFPLWMFVGAGAVQAGLPPDQLPDWGQMFRQVSATVGSDDLYKLLVPEQHQPHLNAKQAVELFWIPIGVILNYKGGPGPAAGHNVAVEHWPIVLGIVAQQLIVKVKDVLNPAIAATLVMHSAIIGSKFDVNQLQLRQPT